MRNLITEHFICESHEPALTSISRVSDYSCPSLINPNHFEIMTEKLQLEENLGKDC